MQHLGTPAAEAWTRGPIAATLANVPLSMSVVTELRRTRRSRRLGDTEWFDLAYHVYLAGIFGGSAIIIASDYVGDTPLDTGTVDDVLQYGPAVLGIIVAVTVLSGLRAGATGGPVSVERADVRHLLLAPVSRASVLRIPTMQRLRASIGGGVIAGGVAGLLAAQRIPGTAPAWTLSGAAFGACVGAVAIAAAALAHEFRLGRWQAASIGTALLAWQGWAAASESVIGPFDGLGSLALWGNRQEPTDLVGVAIILAGAALAVGFSGRLRPEHLARRSALVSQLRFAVTTQDLRTVVLLRRQLRQERLRSRPWIPRSPASGGPTRAVIRRGVSGLDRLPIARLLRLAVLGGAAGAAAGLTARGTTSAAIACGILLFVLGLDLVEPLSQEVDHPDLTMTLPRSDGWLHERLLVAPLALAVPAALVGAAVCSLVAPASATAAFVLAVPIVWVGITGAVVNVVRDSDAGPSAESLIMPPEMAGFRDVARIAIPVVVASVGVLAILAVRWQPDAGMVARVLIGLALFLVLMRWWIVHRIDLKERRERFIAGANV